MGNSNPSTPKKNSILAGQSGRWVALECLPALALILLVWPITWLGGDVLGWRTFVIAGALTLSSGDLLAAGFCFLLPLFARSVSGTSVKVNLVENKMLTRIVISLLAATAFYWLSKIKPVALPLTGEISENAIVRAVIYCLAALLVSAFAISTAFHARKTGNW